MWKVLLVLLILTTAILIVWSRRLHMSLPAAAAASRSEARAAKPNFETEIKPIFQTRCQPCHFPGGKVYSKMPFDKPETITRLGSKLFTRITDEKEKKLIQAFLDQP